MNQIEMLSKLIENPKLRFKCVTNGLTVYVDKYGSVVCRDEENDEDDVDTFTLNVRESSSYSIYEIIKEPVS